MIESLFVGIISQKPIEILRGMKVITYILFTRQLMF